MNKDLIAKLEEKKQYLLKLLSRYEKAQDIIPSVQKNLDLTEYEIQALSNPPDEAAEIQIEGLSDNIERDYKLTVDAYPMIPKYKAPIISSSTGITTSGSATVYDFVAKVGDLDTPEAKSYSQLYVDKYHQLQEAQSRSKDVRFMISKLRNDRTLERFDKAEKSYSLFKARIVPKTSSATEIRTLVDGVKGDLFNIARNWPKENMTWEKMVERLAIGEVQKQELTDQEKTHSSLISRLSDVLKEREGGSVINLENIWTQVLDYLFVLFSLVNLEKA